LFACKADSGSSEDEEEPETVYELGDAGPAGGLIFYVDAADAFPWTYLEAAPASTEFSEIWSNVVKDPVGPGAQGTAIGTGKANTEAIVAQAGLAAGAAKACADLVAGGYDDWFLPSKGELAAIRDNLYVKDLGSFHGDNYWSSTEYDEDEAYLSEFSKAYVNETQYAKNASQYARAIRAF
jgi:hypothetical protein